MPSPSDLAPQPWIDSPWVLGLVVFILWMAVFMVARRIVLGTMRRVAAGHGSAVEDILARALSAPLLIAIATSGLLVLARILPISPRWDRAVDVLLTAAIVLALILFVDRAARGTLDRLAAESMALQGARGLIQGIVRGLSIGLGLLILLDSMGVSITPLLASLGVGSLAVALALQDTLNNIFAGLYIVADKPVEAGHLIRLEGGEEGCVLKVGWRSTWIRTPLNSIVVVPNVKMAGSVITNYTLLDPTAAINVPATLRYDTDLEKAERITLEVARDVLRSVEGGVPEIEPTLRFTSFGDSGITLSVNLRCARFEATALVRHELLRRLHERYRREGIAVSFPTRTIDLPPRDWSALGGSLPPTTGPRAGFRPEDSPHVREPGP